MCLKRRAVMYSSRTINPLGGNLLTGMGVPAISVSTAIAPDNLLTCESKKKRSEIK